MCNWQNGFVCVCVCILQTMFDPRAATGSTTTTTTMATQKRPRGVAKRVCVASHTTSTIYIHICKRSSTKRTKNRARGINECVPFVPYMYFILASMLHIYAGIGIRPYGRILLYKGAIVCRCRFRRRTSAHTHIV